MGRPTLLYVSILAEPGAHDMSVFETCADGPDDRGWFRARLQELRLIDNVRWQPVNAAAGEALPDLASVDAVIVGGSLHSANEDRPWQTATMRWLEHYRAQDRPLLAICGGHQMLCRLAGAEVAPLADGPWAATRPVPLTAAGRAHALFAGLPAAPRFFFGNYDHVTAAPAGSTVLAGDDDSPCLALDYGGGWLSTQFHPELTAAIMALAWSRTAPQYIANYVDTPFGLRLLGNLLAPLCDKAGPEAVNRS